MGAKKVTIPNYLGIVYFREVFMNGALKLYYIDDNYINYLRKFDSRVYYNKSHTRPYVGVVYTFNGYYYFAPLSSPKAKHLQLNPNAVDIFKIKNGLYGIVNINNMIPTPKECLTEAIANTVDPQYRNLLITQTRYLNSSKNALINKVNQFQSRYTKKHLPKNVLNRCCNYPLLESKCQEYINNYIK